MLLAVAIAVLISPLTASLARQPDLLVQARYACTDCLEGMSSDLRPCAASASERAAFGDVIVRLALTPGTDVDSPMYARGTVTASASDGLGRKVASCVEERLRQLECLQPCYVDHDGPIDIPLGEPRPLLPELSDLLPRWRAYKDSSWLTRWWRGRRFVRSLAADIRLTPEGCLWIPDALNLHVGLMAWEKRLGHGLPSAALYGFARGPTKARWQASWDRGYQVSANEAILVDEGPSVHDREGGREWREYDGTGGVRICLMPLDAA
jgi:hypothetical protein